MNLKPVIFLPGGNPSQRHRQNHFQQVLLLKALTTTQDPKKLKNMIGVRTVAEVFRTLDKMALRKEYHKALENSGISFEYIIKGIKEVADEAPKFGDRLSALKTLLKSLGVESYDVENQGSGNWESELMRAEPGRAITQADYEDGGGDYKVNVPMMPSSVSRARDQEKKDVGNIYD
jgi:hypothetical protein